MNILDPWNIVFLVGLVVYFNIRRVIIKRLNLLSQKKAVSRFDWLEKMLLLVMGIGLLSTLLYLFTPLLDFADYHLPAAVPWFGTAVMLVSLWLFWRSHKDLGENWSVSLELREEHKIVATGVYRRIRHPMYLSMWLLGISQGMILQNWLAGWSFLVTFAVMYVVRMPREERLMCEQFGDNYRDYMRRTGRLFPRLGKQHEVVV